MSKKEIENILSENGLIEYLGDMYEYIGTLGMYYMFSNISNGNTLTFREQTLLNSDDIYYISKEEHDKIREEYLKEVENAGRI